jgi:hypothetical protein
MKCDIKTLVKVVVGLGAGLAVVYAALPEARAFLLASSPFLLVLLCPLAMGAMMLAMKNEGVESKPNDLPPPVGREPGQDKT